jgi:hypothetical protein
MSTAAPGTMATALPKIKNPETADTILFGVGSGIIVTGGQSDTTVVKYWPNK